MKVGTAALGGLSGVTASPAPVGLEAVWPRRFEPEGLKALLGDATDEALCDVLARSVNAPLWDLADRGGRKWRPVVCRLAFLVSGGAAPVPASICQVAELLHTGSLIVDDIQDGATERRGGPVAHAIYGVPAALNAANTAYFRALERLRVALPSGPRLRALDMLAEELFAAHLGQGLDLALGSDPRERALTSGHYLLLARAKTGALVRIAARLGAIAAGADAPIEAALAEWASEVGVAYQIRNDVADLANGMLDVAGGRPTYPLLLVLERDDRAATTLRRHLGRGLLSRSEHRRLRTLFVRERLAERAGAEAERAAARALAALRSLPQVEARARLERMAADLAGDATHA